jgi:hypothetical protein
VTGEQETEVIDDEWHGINGARTENALSSSFGSRPRPFAISQDPISAV